MDDLSKSLKEADDYFCHVIDLVHPDHFGFDEEIKEELKNRKHEIVDKKLNNYERKRFKEHGRQLLGRLDSSRCRTVTEIWAWQMEQNSKKRQNFKNNSNSNSNVFPTKINTQPEQNGTPSTRKEIAAKLQNKIAAMRVERKASKKSRKRKKKEEKDSKKTDDKRPKLNSAETTIKTEITNGEHNIPGNSHLKNIPAQQQTPVTNSKGQTVFSKFDFSVLGVKSKSEEKKKKRKSKLKLSGRDYKKLLQTVEKRDEVLESLKTENPEKARSIESQQHWDAAMDRAEGLKVKDDKNLLQKSLKRREKQKKTSGKQWANREDHVKHKIDKRQENRQRNLKSRKDDKKKKKLDKARKKGRLV